MSTIGERLKAERERLGLSQTALGEICQVTKGTQINYEKGDRSPDALYLAAFHAAGGDVMWVVTGQHGAAPQAPALAPDEAALLDNYRKSPPAGRDALKATSAALAKSTTAKRKAG